MPSTARSKVVAFDRWSFRGAPPAQIAANSPVVRTCFDLANSVISVLTCRQLGSGTLSPTVRRRSSVAVFGRSDV